MDGEASEAFADWLRPRLPALLRLAAALSGSAQAAEDLVQDVMAKACLHWGRVQAARDPDAYLRAMVVNEHVSWRRRLARTWRFLAARAAEPASIDSGFDQEVVDQAALNAEIARLPPRQRAVIVLRFLEDLSVGQTARILGCGESTVRATTTRALTRLRVERTYQPTITTPATGLEAAPDEDHHAH